jgi:hypothetical protein
LSGVQDVLQMFLLRQFPKIKTVKQNVQFQIQPKLKHFI